MAELSLPRGSIGPHVGPELRYPVRDNVFALHPNPLVFQLRRHLRILRVCAISVRRDEEHAGCCRIAVVDPNLVVVGLARRDLHFDIRDDVPIEGPEDPRAGLWSVPALVVVEDEIVHQPTVSIALRQAGVDDVGKVG